MLTYTLKKFVHPIKFTIMIILLLHTRPDCFAEEGVFTRKIVLATHQPLSGPAREYSEIGKSALAYFKYVNDQGGIHGRAIELIMFDDQLQPEITVKDFIPFTFKKDIFWASLLLIILSSRSKFNLNDSRYKISSLMM